MSTANAAAVDDLLRAVRDLVDEDNSRQPLTRDLLDLIDCLVVAVTAEPMADTEYVDELLDRLRSVQTNVAAARRPVVRGVSACMR